MSSMGKYVECKNCKKKCFSGDSVIEIFDNNQSKPIDFLSSAIYACSQECFEDLDNSLTENSTTREVDVEIALKK